MYKTTEHITLDDQLVTFQVQYPFQQFVPKPMKYDIKLFTLTSTNNYYTTI